MRPQWGDGLCYADKTYSEAKEICQGLGKSICGFGDLHNGLCCDKGCEFDSKYNWVEQPSKCNFQPIFILKCK